MDCLAFGLIGGFAFAWEVAVMLLLGRPAPAPAKDALDADQHASQRQ
jgi:hypothetical protein